MALTKVHNRMIAGSVSNVIDFGAIGDGVADDSGAIQAALTATGVIYIPAGTYRIDTKLNLIGNTQITGDGPEKTILQSYVDDYCMEMTSANRGRVYIDGIKLENKGAGSNAAGIYQFGPNSGEITNVDVRDFPQQAFHFVQTVQGEVHNAVIVNCGIGVEFDGGSTFTVIGSLRDLYIAGGTTGVLASTAAASALHLDNVVFENLTTGMSAPIAVGGVAVNCWFESCTNGFVLNDSSGFLIEAPSFPGTTNPYVLTYSGSVPYYAKANVVYDQPFMAYAFGYRTGAQNAAAAAAFANVTFSAAPEVFYVNWNPGGGAPADIDIVQGGVYELEFYGNVTNASTSAQSFAMRATLDGTEIAGSYCAGAFDNTVANANAMLVSKKVIFEAAASQTVNIQFAATATTCKLDSSVSGSLPAATTANSAGFVIRHLGTIK